MSATAFTNPDSGLPIPDLPSPLPCPFCGHTQVEIHIDGKGAELCASARCGYCGTEAGWSSPDPREGRCTEADCIANAAAL